MRRTALLIDGGHLRKSAEKNGYAYTPDFIEAFAHRCIDADDDGELYRILYYDCPVHTSKQILPRSGEVREFYPKPDDWLKRLAVRPYFAVRRGSIQWRGWRLKPGRHKKDRLEDDDFDPDWRQKGVDMRFGLDVATLAHASTVFRVILVAADRDFIPAMKYGRSRGLQIALVLLPGFSMHSELREHADILRPVPWPEADRAADAHEQARPHFGVLEGRAQPAASEHQQVGQAVRARIKAVVEERGFGFVTCTESGEDFYFALDSPSVASLEVGALVACEVLHPRGEGGRKHGHVHRVRLTTEEDLEGWSD